jgi:hypothetical protein
MDTAFFTGGAAFLSAILIFVGSAFLLLMLIVGPRLAYWITASVALAFILVMTVAWSVNPLGPVGQLPEWDPVEVAEDPSAIEELGPASEYPDEPWRAPNEDDEVESAQAAELESGAIEYFTEALDEGEVEFTTGSTATAVSDSTRLLTQGEEQYGMTRLEVINPADEVEGEVAVAMKYDPGNPLGMARSIAIGTLILLVLHLFGLSWAERHVREERAEARA